MREAFYAISLIVGVLALSFLAGVGFMSGVIHAMENHEASIVFFKGDKTP